MPPLLQIDLTPPGVSVCLLTACRPIITRYLDEFYEAIHDIVMYRSNERFLCDTKKLCVFSQRTLAIGAYMGSLMVDSIKQC